MAHGWTIGTPDAQTARALRDPSVGLPEVSVSQEEFLMGLNEVAKSRPRVHVIQLSEAFGDVWEWLADELTNEVEVHVSANGLTAESACAMVVLSAGAAEAEAQEWLDSHALPAGIPAVVAGVDYGRRWAIRSVRAGAADYFALPDDLPLLRSAVAVAADRYRERGAFSARVSGPDPLTALVGESPAMEAVRERAGWVSRYPGVPALILGESGTGREFLARAIHKRSGVRTAPFVPVSCGSVDGRRMTADLFGLVQGSGESGTPPAPGLLEIADGGTVHFDDITALPAELQADLTSVLRTQVIRRVGATKDQAIQVRFLASIPDPVEPLLADGSLDESLYRELSVVTLQLPPLRERGGDVLLIAGALLERLAHEYRVPVPTLDEEAKCFLTQHTWPGNVRELKSVLVRALLLSPAATLPARELEAAVRDERESQVAEREVDA